MKRRVLLKRIGLTGLGAVAAGGGWLWLAPRPPVAGFASFQAVRDVLQGWRALAAPPAAEGWPVAQVLAHCAQSIEFSLSGFPALKPAWFRSSVGPLAFAVFDTRGAMQHSLVEPIPGAPTLDDAAWPAAMDRLEAAITAFQAHEGPLQPHFAYGELDKPQYTRAHLMHLAQHWTRFAAG